MEDFIQDKAMNEQVVETSIWIIKCTFHIHGVMNDVLKPVIDLFIIIYLDDILVYNQSWE